MIVAAHGLTHSVAGQRLCDAIDLEARPGEITALVGPSGSGKTVLLHALGLLLRPDAGAVLVDGDDTSRWSTSKKRRFWASSAAFVLQEGDLVEEESVAYNVTMSKSLLRGRTTGDPTRIAAALDAVGLSDREHDRAVSLSAGEKQRLSFARALYKDAEVVFVDEPTASLDAANRANLIKMMRDLADQGRTVIIATHDDELIALADAVVAVGQNTSAPTAPVRQPQRSA